MVYGKSFLVKAARVRTSCHVPVPWFTPGSGREATREPRPGTAARTPILTGASCRCPRTDLAARIEVGSAPAPWRVGYFRLLGSI